MCAQVDSTPGEVSEPLDRYFEPTFKGLPEKLKSSSSFWVKFSMGRSGVTVFEVPEDIEKHVHPNAPTFPINPDLRKNLIHSVSSQLFFFLKDLAHVHQHHHPRTDTMVDLYPSGDDYGWRCETMRVLQRRILQYKRISNANVFKSSKGVLAYAKSFSLICDDDGIEVEPKWHYEPLEQSIQAAQDRDNAELSNRIRKLDIARNWMLGLLGIVISMTSVLSLTGSSNSPSILKNTDVADISVWFAKAVAGYPLEVLLGYALFYFAVNVFAGNYDISRLKFVRHAIRLIQP